MKKHFFPLQTRPKASGYGLLSYWCEKTNKIRPMGVYFSSNLHARINARVGLWVGGYNPNGEFIVWSQTGARSDEN